MPDSAGRRMPVALVTELAARAGVPAGAIPIVVTLNVEGGRAIGWASMLLAERPLTITGASGWPAGWLTLVGALVDAIPADRDRPYFGVGGPFLEGYLGTILIHDGRGQVSVKWPVGPVGSLSTDIKLSSVVWTDTDIRAATRAARWLESLPRQGRGRRPGSGSLWPGGDDDFLDDLWTTLETLTKATGTQFGHDPVSKLFRSKMREQPAGRTMRTRLADVGLQADAIKSGRVTRANYRQFVGA